jgi:hypothetical protein
MFNPPILTGTDVATLRQELQTALQDIAREQAQQNEYYALKPLYAEPKRIIEGMAVVADGTVWNPGSGAGEYIYLNGSWRPNTSETGWRDLVGDIRVQDIGSAAAPAWSVYQGNIKAWEFPASGGAATREVFLVYHIDHDYKPGSDFHIHAHWSCAAGATGNVKWYFEIMYAKGHNQAAFPAAVTSSVVQAASATAYQHMVAEVQMSAASPSAAQVDSDLLEVDGILLVRAYRNRDDAADTCNQSVFLHTVDIHYQTDRTATINKAPNFYGV